MGIGKILSQGNTQGAQVEARRFIIMRTYLDNFDKENAHGVAGSYNDNVVDDFRPIRGVGDEPDALISRF